MSLRYYHRLVSVARRAVVWTLPAAFHLASALPLAVSVLAPLRRCHRALLTLELHEARSNLTGATIAAALDGLEATEAAAHAAPDWTHALAQWVSRLLYHLGATPMRAARSATSGCASGTTGSSTLPGRPRTCVAGARRYGGANTAMRAYARTLPALGG